MATYTVLYFFRGHGVVRRQVSKQYAITLRN